MFAKATSKFVTEIDPDGCLIPVSRLNESDNLTLTSLVIKRSRFWFWQRPKYLPSDFTLNDILQGETKIDPGLIETDFLKYNSTLENNTSGAAEAGFGPGNVNLSGKGSSKLASSFGNLKKQELDLQKVLDQTKDRVLDMQHSLIQQTQQKRTEVFALVKERIVTTQPCTVTEEVQEGGSCGAFFGLTVPKKISVSVKNGSHQSDSNVSVEIPAKTALAYCLIELSVKATGQFELCLMPDTYGSMEVDGPVKKNVAMVYGAPPQTPNKQLQRELNELQSQFAILSGLPASTRSSLLQQLTALLKDKTAISALDLAIEDLCCGKKPDLSTLDKTPSLKAAVKTTLELLQSSNPTSHSKSPQKRNSSEDPLKPSIFTSANVLTSALDEMTDSTLLLLKSCCQSSSIHALQALVQNVVGNKTCSLKDRSVSALAEEKTFSRVKALFDSSNITLCKEEDAVRAEIRSQQGHAPLILCIAIRGLACLATPA
ncbi:gasdermin Eb [Astyanax mexicanus]|uniref:Gasdermin E n=1 Tax=Astyanax mexicanus TaxID=7994 RepID=A0A8B9KDE0_ASTMX|nr:gasdermin Eb [Astyanax mexicanus]KAG9276674.1 non-syndromic hearing impairment protein 5 [Astyanax mexicanus]